MTSMGLLTLSLYFLHRIGRGHLLLQWALVCALATFFLIVASLGGSIL